jgi:hypothetical protein
MIYRRRHDLVLAIHVQSRGFAFILFEGRLTPVDWGVQEIRGADRNAHCMTRIASLLALHTPDVLVLQDMSDLGTVRAPRIQELNRRIAELASQCGVLVCTYSRVQVVDIFDEQFSAVTKQGIAQVLAKHIPALDLYLPPARKPWMSEDARMGIFDAAALAWTYFHKSNRQRKVA